MLSKTFSAALQGIDAYTVEIEVNATELGEKTNVLIVGLPDMAVRESRERVRSAVGAQGFLHPYGTTTVNLAPADVRKEGAAFDLGIAIGMLAATQQLPREALPGKMFLGELALDGGVRACPGALPVAMHARAAGFDTLLLPEASATEAGIVDGITIIGIKTLRDAVDYLTGDLTLAPTRTDIASYYAAHRGDVLDMAEVKGQEGVKRALEVAAAGGHNMLLIGPPGTGKTLLASRLPSILPLMELDEALETTKIHSIAGQLDKQHPLVVARPFRAPHHTISDAGLLGGASDPRPGEVSLAHNGVLFLDEFTEFKRQTLEVMRQPLEGGSVTISRAARSVTYPARFQLIAAMNPCPCGYYGSTQRECRCGSREIQQYRARISGPLLDRIDIHTEVAPLADRQLMGRPNGEPSTAIRDRVVQARQRQLARFAGGRTRCNAHMSPKEMQAHCQLDEHCQQVLRVAIHELNLSARAYDRILRVARTLADLEGREAIALPDISEAVQYRTLDRQLW